MKNRLIFRILGALASSLIILSVFMPFTSVSTANIWDMNNSTNMMYLPIMIITFGGIGFIFFSLNIKTEFAYASSGAIIFYTVVQFFQALYNENLNILGIGFYFLAIGGVVIGFMAFLCNMRVRQKKVEPVQNSEAVVTNPINMPVINTQTIDNVSPSLPVEQPVQVSVQPQIEPPRIAVDPQISEANTVSQSQPFEAPVYKPLNDINMTQQSTNQPIPEIVEQPVIHANDSNVQTGSGTFASNPQPIPNNVPQVSPTPLPNVQPAMNSTPVNNQESVTPNPVVREFEVPQGQPSFNSDNQASNQNMQGLDIFGNFN